MSEERYLQDIILESTAVLNEANKALQLILPFLSSTDAINEVVEVEESSLFVLLPVETNSSSNIQVVGAENLVGGGGRGAENLVGGGAENLVGGGGEGGGVQRQSIGIFEKSFPVSPVSSVEGFDKGNATSKGNVYNESKEAFSSGQKRQLNQTTTIEPLSLRTSKRLEETNKIACTTCSGTTASTKTTSWHQNTSECWKNVDENNVLARYNVYCDGCVEDARKSSAQVFPLKKKKRTKTTKVEVEVEEEDIIDLTED
jgi:hypothetical protein